MGIAVYVTKIVKSDITSKAINHSCKRTYVPRQRHDQTKKEKPQKLLFSVLGTGVEVQRLIESPTGADTAKKMAQTLLGRAINHYHICATAIK